MFNEQVDGNIDIVDLRMPTSGFGDFRFQLANYYDSDLIQELKDQGIEVNEEDVVADVENRGIPVDNPYRLQPEDSRIIWMEQERFSHILLPHRVLEFKNDFDIWDDATTIGNFIFNAIKGFPIVNIYPGEGGQSKFYVYEIFKTRNFLKVLVHDDGSIITAFPSEYKN